MNGHEIKLINRNAKHQQDLLQHRDRICRTIPAGTYGSTPHLLKTVVNDTTLRIRKLTPKECWRLMGFDDEDFYKAEKVCSNSQLYKQAGNSIVVDVLEYLFREIMEVLEVKKVDDKVIVYECDSLINLEALKEKEPDLCRVSLRSKGIDVTKIALQFGGGAHVRAAGCSIEKNCAEARNDLIKAILQVVEAES